VNYGYDALNRMGTATDSAGVALATYGYDNFSRRSGLTYANTASVGYTYTTAGDLTRLVNQLTDSNSVTYTLGYTGAHELDSETASKAKYVWDPSQQGGTDAYGAPNDLNQYPNVTFSGQSQQNFSYSRNGSLTSDGVFDYAYDPENRLLSAGTISPSGSTATYAYDPKGRRSTKTSGGTTTNFLDDGDDEIAEYDGSGTLLRRYVPGPAIDEPIAYVTASGTYEYFHTDHHGSVIAMSDSTGALAEGAFTYDSYGNSNCSGSGTVPFRYTGQYLDPETCLYYYRARYYSPLLGRFLQTDPVGYTADMDLYTYVGNDPLNRTDPTGRMPSKLLS
jgi:RHS repeat-associated protein